MLFANMCPTTWLSLFNANTEQTPHKGVLKKKSVISNTKIENWENVQGWKLVIFYLRKSF